MDIGPLRERAGGRRREHCDVCVDVNSRCGEGRRHVVGFARVGHRLPMTGNRIAPGFAGPRGGSAPNSAHRARVTPAKRGKRNKASASHAPEHTSPAEHEC